MSLLNDILKQIQGGAAQVNPFDGGQDYRSVTQPRKVQGQRGMNPGAPLAPLPARAMIPDGQPGGYALPRVQGLVEYEDGSNSAGGRAMDSIDDFPQFAPRPAGIQGAINPMEQINRRGGTAFSLGEGPLTRY